MSTSCADFAHHKRALRRSEAQILAVLTGASGLGAETLFFKLLDFTAGSSPTTSHVVVSGFILGVGLGALLSPRVRRPLFVELSLAALALAIGLLPDASLALAAAALEALSGRLSSAAAANLLAACVVVPTATMLGITFPALVEREGQLARLYLLQAVGAVFGVVFVEGLLFPLGGLRLAFLFVAALHLVSALLLRGAVWRFAVARLERLAPRLIIAGTLTGLYQGLWLFLALLLFHPFYFVQPVVVLAMLGGLYLGAQLWLRRRWSFVATLGLIGLGVGVSSVLAALAARLPTPASFWPVIPALLVLVGAGSVPIGALYPSHFGTDHVDRARAGAGLLSIALGNVLGFLCTGLLTALLPVAWLFTLVTVGLWGLAKKPSAPLVAGVTASLLSGAFLGDRSLMARDRGVVRGDIQIEKIIRGPAELTGIYSTPFVTGARTRRLYQTGFSPIDLDHGLEVSIALAGVAYAPEHRRALVIGAGSGKTAGVVARAFEETEVFDVGATVRPLLEYLSDDNYQLLAQPGVRYRGLDGILAPYVVAPGLDLIVVTVDPAYHFRAAKLYAEETLRALSGLLRPGGVLVFWADATTDAEAAQTLINTGAAVFAHQRIFLATPGPRGRKLLKYFFLVHSDAPLSYRFDREPVRRVVALDEKTRFHAEPTEAFRLPAAGRLHPTAATHRLVAPSSRILLGGFGTQPLELR